MDTATEAQKRASAAIPSHQALIASQVRRKAATDQALADQQRLVELANQPIIDVSVNQEQGLVATLLSNGTIRVYRSESGMPVEEFAGQTETLSNATSNFAIGRLAWAGDELIATAPSATPRVKSLSKSWQLHRVIGSLDDPDTISDRVTALGFRQDGLSIAIGSGAPSRSGQVKVFSTVSGQLLRDFGDVHSDSVLGVAFAPLGDTIASAGADKTIRLLDVASGETRRSLEGHTHHVLALAWQDDGRSLASASADRTVKIWDVETGEQRRTIGGFGKEITAVAFVGTTNQLATACADGQARLYDTSNGKAIRTFKASGDFLFSLGVSFDGEKLLASGQSGVVRAWNVKDGKLLKELTP